MRDGRNPYAVIPGGAAAAHAGVSVRRQPGDVRADRQLQGRPGARAGDPAAAGAMRCAPEDRSSPRCASSRCCRVWLIARARRAVAALVVALAAVRGGRAARCGASPPSPCCCCGWPARGWCRRPARPCPISACWWWTRPPRCRSATAPRLAEAARAAIEAQAAQAARPGAAHHHRAGERRCRHPAVRRDRPRAGRHPALAPGRHHRHHRRAGARHPGDRRPAARR